MLEGVLEPLLTLRVCRGDAPDGGSRSRAQNPPPTAPFVRISLTGCSIDGKKKRKAASSKVMSNVVGQCCRAQDPTSDPWSRRLQRLTVHECRETLRSASQ